MIQVTYHPTPRYSITASGTDQDAVLKELTSLSEIFKWPANECGVCNSQDIVVRTRNQDGIDYVEACCQAPSCRAKLNLGKNKEGGTRWPRVKYHKQHPDVIAKKAKVGDRLPNNGWTKYVKPDQDNHEDVEVEEVVAPPAKKRY